MTAKKYPYPTPTQNTHKYCTTRCMQSAQEVKKCGDTKCPLYPNRNGENPNRKGKREISNKERNGDSGKILPLYEGKKRIIEAISDGRKKISVIIEEIGENPVEHKG